MEISKQPLFRLRQVTIKTIVYISIHRVVSVIEEEHTRFACTCTIYHHSSLILFY